MSSAIKGEIGIGVMSIVGDYACAGSARWRLDRQEIKIAAGATCHAWLILGLYRSPRGFTSCFASRVARFCG